MEPPQAPPRPATHITRAEDVVANLKDQEAHDEPQMGPFEEGVLSRVKDLGLAIPVVTPEDLSRLESLANTMLMDGAYGNEVSIDIYSPSRPSTLWRLRYSWCDAEWDLQAFLEPHETGFHYIDFFTVMSFPSVLFHKEDA